MTTPDANVDQLRCEVDRGRTGDKVPGFDPAMAPIGTDEEAAGTSVDGGAVQRVRTTETRTPHVRGERRGLGSAWVLVGAEILLAAVFIAAGVVLR